MDIFPKFALALFILALFSSFYSMAKIEVHGHRGAAGARPENTLAAMKYALEVGVDFLEFDLAVTKDNVLVVSHDPYVNSKLCLKNGKKIPNKIVIKNLTLKEVKAFDCGSLKNKKFKNQKTISGQKIPTLSEVFEFALAFKGSLSKKVQFNIETKIYPHYPNLAPTPETFSRLLVKEIKKYKLEKRVVVQSFDHRTLKWVKKIDPKISIAQLTYYSFPDLVALSKSIGAEYSSPNHDWLTKDMVQKLQEAKIKVVPWTANTKKDWQKLKSFGVDGIITDHPGKLIKFLSE